MACAEFAQKGDARRAPIRQRRAAEQRPAVARVRVGGIDQLLHVVMPAGKIALELGPREFRGPRFLGHFVRLDEPDEIEQRAAAADVVRDEVPAGAHPHRHHFVHQAAWNAIRRERDPPSRVTGIGCGGVAGDLLAHDRLQAVGSDKKVAARARAVGEFQLDAAIVFNKARRPMVEVDRAGIELAHLCGEQLVQIGAMHLDIGCTVQPLMLFGKLEALDHFPGVEQLEHIGLRPHADPRDRGAQPQMIEHVHRVRAHLDAGADFGQLRRLLEHRDLVSGLDQTRRRGEAADAGSCDQDSQRSQLHTSNGGGHCRSSDVCQFRACRQVAQPSLRIARRPLVWPQP